MDIQLKEIIDRINADGVKNAEESAKRIIAEAENKASAIVNKAREDAETTKKTARADAEKAERSGREALRQAGRDLVITVKAEIGNIFSRVLAMETAKALDGALLAEAVRAAVGRLAGSEPGSFELLVPEGKFDQLRKDLLSVLSNEFSKGLEIRPFKGIEAGFRVSKKDGSAFFDFSDKEVASMLGRYLNPRLAELLSD